ncbi:MAG TPA: hypothetical protein PKB06_02325 [Actinotalea sp.]|nr:hypothetical protein [Actinotalea sp.]
MTIRPFTRVLHQDEAFQASYELVTASKIVRRITDALREDAGKRTGRPTSSPYTVGVVLVVLGMCLYLRLPVTYPNMLSLLWHLTGPQLFMLGVEECVTLERRTRMYSSEAVWQAEHKAFAKKFRQICNVMDCSPHPKMSIETNAARTERGRRLTPNQRLKLEARDGLLDEVTNALIEVSLRGMRPSWYRGHVTFDETWLISRITTRGRGTRPDKLACPDPTLAWRTDKKTGRPIYVTMIVLAAAAVLPRERGIPLITTGIRVRKPTGETDADAAVAVVRYHVHHGYGPGQGRAGRAYADQGYTQKVDLAGRLLEFNYSLCTDAGQPQPVAGFRLPEGPLMIAGVLVCPAGGALLPHRNLTELDENAATDADLWQRHDITEEIHRHRMPTNGRPIPYPITSKHHGMVKIRVACPAACELIQCPWVPESLDPTSQRPAALSPPVEPETVCRSANSHVRLPLASLKHLDVDIRGSFRHTDAFGLNRSAIEKINGFIQRADMGGFSPEAMQPLGRVPAGLAAAYVCAFNNLRIKKRVDKKWGTVEAITSTAEGKGAKRRTRRMERSRPGTNPRPIKATRPGAPPAAASTRPGPNRPPQTARRPGTN